MILCTLKFCDVSFVCRTIYTKLLKLRKYICSSRIILHFIVRLPVEKGDYDSKLAAYQQPDKEQNSQQDIMGKSLKHWNIALTLVLFTTTASVAFERHLEGKRARCQNEGDRVAVDYIDKHRCYFCICKNGYVECSNDCPRTDECHMIVEDGCCKKCKGCMYNGIYYESHTEWMNSSTPCKVIRCEAGVVTESELHCHTPCANPLPPEPGKCCPRCSECKINGQITSDDRDVISDDPCLKCRCDNGKMICSKKACPVLQCTITRQYHSPGECCPRCKGTRALIAMKDTCTLQTSLFREGANFNIDKCTNCTCQNGTSVCTRASCPILDCAPELHKSVPGSCCKKCIMPEEVRSQCVYRGVLYEDGQQWNLDSCKSCRCHRGMPSCAITRCNTTCTPGTRLVKSRGECCPKCVPEEGVCMVFGDPHYKSFDGSIFTFKGVGKYQLTADCVNYTFSIKVANTNKISSSFTKRVAIRYEDKRINLQQKGRVKYNGQRIKPPYEMKGIFRVQKLRDEVEVTLQNGVKLIWNGKSFLEISVPASYKNKLCGLCGNFNSNVQDDFKTKGGRVLTDKEILSFGTSWFIGKKSEGIKKNKPINKGSCTKHRSEINFCKYLNSEPFTVCESKLNYSKYYKACKMDMCHCPNGKCYCESLMAYARECQRLGVQLPNWQKYSYCDVNNLRRPSTNLQAPHKSQKYNNKYVRRNFNKTRGSINPISIH